MFTQRLKTNGTAIKITRKTTNNQKKKYNSVKHIQRQQFSSTKTSIKESLKLPESSSLNKAYYNFVLSRLLGVFFFSRMNSRYGNRSKLSFTARIRTKYSLERFLSIWGEKMSKGFLKFCKLLILGQIIVSNLTIKNVHKLNSRINYARLH